MKTMETESVDLTITSPPYDSLRSYDELPFEKFKPVAKEMFRLTKNGGIVVWVSGDATIKCDETATSFKQVLFFKEVGFKLLDTMIWNKGSFTAVGALTTRYAQVFEYMFILLKGERPSNFNPIKDRKNKVKGYQTGRIRQRNGEMKERHSLGKAHKEYGQRFNIWNINTGYMKSTKDKIAYEHPAIFPEELAKDHIISWSNENDTVFDPFCGSGTTGKMAKLLNRKFIGIEKEPKYFEIAKNRIEGIVKGTTG